MPPAHDVVAVDPLDLVALSRINAVDKLDPTIGSSLRLLDANVAAFSHSFGGNNAGLSLQALAAHANVAAGLTLDALKGRVSGDVVSHLIPHVHLGPISFQ